MRLPSDLIFRGKRIDSMAWVCGFLHKMDTCGHGYTGFGIQQQVGNSRPWSSQVDENTIGQYTGMTDERGRAIFEGDIVECWSEGICARGAVCRRVDGLWFIYPSFQKDTMWGLKPDGGGRTTVKIIGNIHDNIDLLEDR